MPAALGIRHMAGLAGRLPADATERVRGAVRTLVGDSVASVAEPALVVAAGPTRNLAGVSESSVCVIAGPLYDLAELAGSLDLPHTTSPDGLVNEAFERWGEEVLAHLTAEAAILAWDRAGSRGFVSRDPLGAASVFWCREGGAVAFASELRILLALVRRRPAPDGVGIAHWLRRDDSRPDITLYEGVSQLPVGHRLRLEPGHVSLESYWRPIYVPPERLSMDEAVEVVQPVLLRAVERRLAPDGTTGILLSGGLDSTSVAGFARALGAQLCGYSNVFPDRPRVDESSWIEAMAASAAVPVVRVAPEAKGLLPDALEFVQRWAAPPEGYDVWSAPLYRQAADDGVGVLLTGDAAETLFNTRFSLIGDRLRSGRVLAAMRLARQAPLGLFYPPPRMLLRILWHEALPAAVPSLGSLILPALEQRRQPSWLRPEVVRTLRDTVGPLPRDEFGGPAWWSRSAYDATVSLPALGLLPYLRRRGESVGLSTRTPFLDIDLVQLALRLPPELAFNGTLTKPVLRAAARGLVPDSVRLRFHKTVWNSLVIDLVAADDWPAIRSLLAGPAAEISQFVRHDRFVDEMLERQPAAGSTAAWSWATDLLRLAVLEVWLRNEAGRDP